MENFNEKYETVKEVIMDYLGDYTVKDLMDDYSMSSIFNKGNRGVKHLILIQSNDKTIFRISLHFYFGEPSKINIDYMSDLDLDIFYPEKDELKLFFKRFIKDILSQEGFDDITKEIDLINFNIEPLPKWRI